MYCFNCGKELSENGKFCPHCGAAQDKRKEDRKDKRGFGKAISTILIILVIVAMALMVLFVSFDAHDTDEGNIQKASEPVSTDKENIQKVPETVATTESVELEDGWNTIDGERYYFQDGKMYVGVHEIDGKMYHFDDEGILSVNEDVQDDGFVMHTGYDGRIEAVTYEAVYGHWAEEHYRFGNGGSSSIMEFSSEVENCDSFTFYLESNGQRGAKVNGNWKFYIRCNGNWEYVGKVNYTEPNGYFDFSFDTPKTFDAITAHPTVQGNASYSSLFYLVDVHCLF